MTGMRVWRPGAEPMDAAATVPGTRAGLAERVAAS